MADFVYLLETRLSAPQQAALAAVRSVARGSGQTVFLVGGAVRDFVSGSPVRDLDVVIQGNALKLRKEFEKTGAVYSGENTGQQSLYLRFPGGIRLEVGSTLSVSYPKPGRPAYKPATILEDLRRRDFTANAMALSLNEGSFGLLMDPLNGVADIENRELRLVSNYGFIEDPVRLIRGARFMARLGWQMEERTRSRYETAKEEKYIGVLGTAERSYELEELFHEEDPLRVMRRLEEEGWLGQLSPALSVAKANAPELARLRESQMQLETRGIRADASAANFPLLVAKLPAKEIDALKKSFPRATFSQEIDTLEAAAKELGSQLLSKTYAAPSDAYKLLMETPAVTVLWAMHSSRSAALQARLKSFLTEWPQAQSRIPYLLLTEMRITPELPEYPEMLDKLVYALMDGQLNTPEEMRSFLEPYSPPAPPPPVSLRRARAPRKEAKSAKSRKKPAVSAAADGAVTSDPEEGSAAVAAETLPAPAEAVRSGSAKKGAGSKEPRATSDAGAPTPKTPEKSSKPEPATKGTKATQPAKKAAAASTEKPVKLAASAAASKSATSASKPTKGTAKKPTQPAAGKNSGKGIASKQAAKPKSAQKKAAPATPVKKAAPTRAAKKSSAPAAKKTAAKPARVKPAAKKVPAKKAAAKKGAAPVKPSSAKKSVSAKKIAPAKKTPAKKATGKRR